MNQTESCLEEYRLYDRLSKTCNICGKPAGNRIHTYGGVCSDEHGDLLLKAWSAQIEVKLAIAKQLGYEDSWAYKNYKPMHIDDFKD